MTVFRLKKEIKELKEAASKKPNPWPRKRPKEEIEALMKKYRAAGLFDGEEK
jgi:hypothetical protein